MWSHLFRVQFLIGCTKCVVVVVVVVGLSPNRKCTSTFPLTRHVGPELVTLSPLPSVQLADLNLKVVLKTPRSRIKVATTTYQQNLLC